MDIASVGVGCKLRMWTAAGLCLFLMGFSHWADASPELSNDVLKIEEVDSFLQSNRARVLRYGETGAQYCLSRSVPAGQIKVPIVALSVGTFSTWATKADIIMVRSDHSTHCRKEDWLLPGRSYRMKISDTAAPTNHRVKLTIKNKDGTESEIFNREFRQAPGRTKEPWVLPDAFLFSPGCEECAGIERLDAYLYAIDVRGSDGKVGKYVTLDLFRLNDEGESDACKAERPDTSMKRSRIECPFRSTHSKQTGTGDGYEPPE